MINPAIISSLFGGSSKHNINLDKEDFDKNFTKKLDSSRNNTTKSPNQKPTYQHYKTYEFFSFYLTNFILFVFFIIINTAAFGFLLSSAWNFIKHKDLTNPSHLFLLTIFYNSIFSGFIISIFALFSYIFKNQQKKKDQNPHSPYNLLQSLQTHSANIQTVQQSLTMSIFDDQEKAEIKQKILRLQTLYKEKMNELLTY
jgi:hypothetical protein